MELLVRTFDKYSGPDIVTKSKTTGRGDVIVVQNDGAYWGPNELKNPAYWILRVPIAKNEAEAMLSPEFGDPMVNPLLQLRKFKLDLGILAGLGYEISDELMAMEARYPKGMDSDEYLKGADNLIVEVSDVDFSAAKIQKAGLENPLVIG
jgi:hypothetical protein